MNAGNFSKVVEHGYKIGTELYLEDAPYYWSTNSKHRICGPYSVQPATLPHHNCKIKQQDKSTGQVIVYYDPDASKGPWLEKRKAARRIEGEEITFSKIAAPYNFFPYRFRIEKTNQWICEIVSHGHNCGWCPFE
jgi:hypothetical protein